MSVSNLLSPQSAQGPGLTFVAFTEAIVKMPISPLWAVLFFAMLITLGLSSQYGILEGVITPIYESKLVPIRKEILSGTLPYHYAIIILLKCESSDSEHHFMLYVQLKVCYVLMNEDQCFWCFFLFRLFVCGCISCWSSVLSKVWRVLAANIWFILWSSAAAGGRFLRVGWSVLCLWIEKVWYNITHALHSILIGTLVLPYVFPIHVIP